MKRSRKLSLECLEKKELLTAYYVTPWSDAYPVGLAGSANPATFRGAVNAPVSSMIPQVTMPAPGYAPLDGNPTFDVYSEKDSVSDDLATIDWGDGHVDSNVSLAQSGRFDYWNGGYPTTDPTEYDSSNSWIYPLSPGVTIPDHVYSTAGTYTVTITISEPPAGNPTGTPVPLPGNNLVPYQATFNIGGGQIMYNAQNGSQSVALPTSTGQQVQVPDNVVGHRFEAYVTPTAGKTIDHVDWTIPDAIQSESWSSAGFVVNYLPANYTVSGNGDISPYWAHGNPNTGAPITSPGGMDQQTISAHVFYTDGTSETLSSNAPVYMPQVTYSAQYGVVSLAPDHTKGDHLAIKTGDVSYNVDQSGDTIRVGQEGYTGTMTVDPTSTRGFGGTAGMIQTVDPYVQRTWVDTTGAVHDERILQYIDPVTNTFSSNPPYLDDDASDPSALMNVWDIGTGAGTPIVRKDSPSFLVDPDFFTYNLNLKFMEYGMYRPGPQNDPNSIYVPLFKAGWQYQATIVNDSPSFTGSNYDILWASNPSTTVRPITIGAYPTWNANAAEGAAQLTSSWQQATVWPNPGGAPAGPHDSSWYSSSLDPAHPYYVSTPVTTTSPNPTPVSSGSTTTTAVAPDPSPVRVDSPKAPVLVYSMPTPMGPRSIPFQATRNRVFQDSTPVRRFA